MLRNKYKTYKVNHRMDCNSYSNVNLELSEASTMEAEHKRTTFEQCVQKLQL